MSLKLKILFFLSIFWMIFWFYVYYVVFARDPAVLTIFILLNPLPFAIVWGLYFLKRIKKSLNDTQQKNEIYPIVNPLTNILFKYPAFLTNCLNILFSLLLMISLLVYFSRPGVNLLVLPTAQINIIIFSYLSLSIVTFVLFLIWVYRMNKNAHKLGAMGMVYSPAESVGWFLVPVGNLIGCYYVMREIWNASENPAGLRKDKTSTYLLKLWWVLILIMSFIKLIPLYADLSLFILMAVLMLTVIIINYICRMQLLQYQNNFKNGFSLSQ